MSKNLVLKGKLEKPLILWNRTRERASEAKYQGRALCGGRYHQETVTKSDIIWSYLATQEVVWRAILKRGIKGKLFAECSTITPEATNKLANRVIEAGAEFVA